MSNRYCNVMLCYGIIIAMARAIAYSAGFAWFSFFHFLLLLTLEPFYRQQTY